MSRKRIAILVGQADEEQQSLFISGFLKQAFQYDYDVCVFSMHRKYQNLESREIGDSNIFQLVNLSYFDAIIFMKDTIQTAGVVPALEARLAKEFKGPVLCIDSASDVFPSIWVDGYTPVYQLISHLIEKHHKTDIGFLTGKKWHKHSQQRLRAFEDCMREHGLEIKPNRIFYGDFWYTSGNACVEQLLRRKSELPEAIACANDQMAIGLCKELVANGIRVPEDIAVVGFDSTDEGRQSPKSITSAYTQQDHFGKRAADSIRLMMKGLGPAKEQPKPRLFIGKTCGCDNADYISEHMFRKEWDTAISSEGYQSPFCTIHEDLFLQEDMISFLNTVYSYIYQLGEIKSFDLCLNEEWFTRQNTMRNINRSDGYSDKIKHVLSYDYVNHKDKMISLDEGFNSSEMLPDLNVPSETPRAYFFVPVFFNSACYGYAAISYGNEARSYDDTFRRWIKSVSLGLEMLSKRIDLKHYLDSPEAKKAIERKFPERITDGQGIHFKERKLSDEEKIELEEVKRILDSNSLEYHFQPIVDTKTGDIYSYEALMRPKSNLRISPLTVIKYADMLDRLGDVEKSTFLNILDLIGSNEENLDGKFVFINSIPGTKMTDEDQVKIIRLLQKYSGKAVVELTEQAELDDDALDKLKDQMRNLGVGIAVDDYGTGYSNVSNLLRYMPDYVKIDRSLLSGIQNSPQKQHFVREIIDFCHSNDIKALAEGVESSEELQTVIILGADLIQGYYTGRPNVEMIPEINPDIKQEILRYQNERKEGRSEIVYIAGKTNRISLSELARSEYTSILVGSGQETYRDIIITGAPGLRSKIHIEVCSGYSGCITIEDCDFSTKENRPTIDIGENCDLLIVLNGDNRIRGGGIRVPETSSLTLEGNGNLQINVNDNDFFGIGNDDRSACGTIEFYQDGCITIQGDGEKGIGIGAGRGGVLNINRGKYVIGMNTSTCVGIGSFSGDMDMHFSDCSIEIDITTATGVGIGSINSSLDLELHHFYSKCYVNGIDVVSMGTIHGAHSVVKCEDLFMNLEARGQSNSTVIGSFDNNSELYMEHATLRATGYGSHALAIGSQIGMTKTIMRKCDVRVDLSTDLDKETYAVPENFTIEETRYQVRINGEDVK